jgi:hypothetical protein
MTTIYITLLIWTGCSENLNRPDVCPVILHKANGKYPLYVRICTTTYQKVKAILVYFESDVGATYKMADRDNMNISSLAPT